MFAELLLTDGETQIDLLSANRHGIGYGLGEMSSSRPQRLPSGLFRQTYGAVNETYEIYISDYDHNGVAGRQQQLDRLLEQAANYFSSGVEERLVYLKARTASETNARYALVFGGVIETYGDLYQQPFVANNGRSTLTLTLGLERSAWLANPPAAPVCLAATNAVNWNPSSEGWVSIRGMNNAQTLFVTAADSVLAANDTIERSVDNGDNWTLKLDPASSTIRFYGFAQIPGGRIYAVAAVPGGAAVADSGIWYSDNDGDTWSQHTASVNFSSVVYRSDGTLFFGGDGEIRYLPDGGALTVLSTVPDGTFYAMAVTETGAIVAADTYATYRIAPGTLTLTRTTTDSAGPFAAIVGTQSHEHTATPATHLLLTATNDISISHDDGLTWAVYVDDRGGAALFVLTNGEVIASESADLYISSDDGLSWAGLTSTGISGTIRSLAWQPGYLFVAAGNAVFRRVSITATYAYGPYEPTCSTPVYVANHRLESNWTHIALFDASGSSYTFLTPDDIATMQGLGNSQAFFTAPAQVNDALYIGIASDSPNVGWFHAVAFDLTSFNATLTIAVEYWNGSAWTALTGNNLSDTTNGFRTSGAIVTQQAIPVIEFVDATIEAYWMRFRVTATGALASVIPAFSNVYLIQQPYIEIEDVAGDIPALAQMTLRNAWGSTLETNRIIAGLRTVDRGELFTAYLNLAQSQNPRGVSVSANFITDVQAAAAGEFARFVPSTNGVEVVRVTIESGLARHYIGTYQVYLRYDYTNLDDNVTVQLAINNFSDTSGVDPFSVFGDQLTLTENGAVAGVARLLHLGQFSITPDRYLSIHDQADTLQFELTITSVDAGNSDPLDMYELILIPSDEWIGEFNDPNVAGSGDLEIIDIDSATFPKRIMRALNRAAGSGLIANVWQSSGSGPFSLQPSIKQRLWILAGTNRYDLDDEEELLGSTWTQVHRAHLWHHARWLGLRGTD